MKHPHTLSGMLLALTALACFATLDTSAKYAALTLPVLLGLWFRYVFQAVATTAIMLPQRGRALFRTGVLARSCCGVRYCSSPACSLFSA